MTGPQAEEWTATVTVLVPTGGFDRATFQRFLHEQLLTGIVQQVDAVVSEPEPLPPACMAGVCGCPSAPDGYDQHVT